MPTALPPKPLTCVIQLQPMTFLSYCGGRNGDFQELYRTEPMYAEFYEDQVSEMASLSRRACYKCGNVGHYAGW